MISFIFLQLALFNLPWWAYSQTGTRALKCGTETVTWSSPGTTISNPTSTTPQACIEQRQFGAGNATFYAITVAVTGATGTITYAWPTPEGPIQFVNSTGTTVLTGTQTGPTVWIRAVTPAAATQQNWGKARLKCEYTIASTCSCKGFATLDLFKQINSTVFPIVGPTCIVPNGTQYTYSVDPVFSRNVNDGIGVDSYNWGMSGGANANPYSSGENSSKTYTFSGSGPWTLSLTSGTTCNNTAATPLSINAGPAQVLLTNPTLGTGYSYTGGQTSSSPSSAAWDFCLDNDKATAITLNTPNTSGITYNWTAIGFTTSTATGPSATFTPLAGAAGVKGTITVTATSANVTCGSTAAVVNIHRRFSSANTITRPTVAGNCLIPGQNYTFTLNGASPATTLYSWSLPGAGWSFVGSNTGTSVTVRVDAGAISSTGPTCAITPTLVGQCLYTVAPSGTPYTIAGGNGYKLKVAALGGGTGSYSVQNDGSAPAPTYTWLPAGTTRFNFNYQWWFSSTSATSGFAQVAQGCGVNSYVVSTPGWIYCIVSPAPNTTSPCIGNPVTQAVTCTTAACLAATNCFTYQTPVVVADPNARPPHHPDTEVFAKENLQPYAIKIVPNPASDKITIQAEGYSKIGRLKIIAMDGRTIEDLASFKPGSEVDIRKLKRGIYKILFQSEEGENAQTFEKE